jgi:hypothetical protein
LLKSRKSRIRRWFLAAAIVVAGPALAIADLAGPASAAPVTSAPKPTPASLGGISCTSAAFCMAVGGTSATMSTGVSAEEWTAGAWHRQPIRKPGSVSNVFLSAVSCPSATECVAVGEGWQGDNAVPVAETWTHSGGWKVSTPVVPSGDGISGLYAVSCPSASLCFAAGAADEFGPVAADQLPLVEQWTTRGWTRVKLPVLRDSAENTLNGISCESATQCAAVGGYSASLTQFGLIEQFKGGTWSASKAPKSVNGILSGVSCPPSAALCVAVGQLLDGRNLVERWSGSTWTAAAAPAPDNTSWLDGVSCASAAHCVAIGGTPVTDESAFVDTLNGTTWTKTAQTGRSFKVGVLYAVSCFSTSARAVSCAAIGGTTSIDATSVPLSAFLTGNTWRVVPTV